MKKRYLNNLMYMLICILFLNLIPRNVIKAKSISSPLAICNYERSEVDNPNVIEAYGCKYKKLVSNFIKKYSCRSSISELQNVENFKKGALEHIFLGEINPRGKAVGFHYEGMPGARGEVIPPRSKLNEFGVYTAKVKINGVKKEANNGESTFFPSGWNPQKVVDKINEAYGNKNFFHGNTYRGTTSEGMTIEMYIDGETDKIISAFPIY